MHCSNLTYPSGVYKYPIGTTTEENDITGNDAFVLIQMADAKTIILKNPLFSTIALNFHW